MELITIEPSHVFVREGLERIRKENGDIAELLESIKTKGQIHPILVTRTAESGLELVAGRRRLLACMAGKLTVHAVVKESMTDLELRELELEENIMRKDFTWQERTQGIAELHALKQKLYGATTHRGHIPGHSQADTAKIVGVSQPRIAQAIHLADAMKAIPELALAKSEKDAVKILHKLEEKVLVAELVKRQQGKESPSLFAAAHFIIQDAFVSMSRITDEVVNFANVDTPYGIDLKHNKKISSQSEGVRTDTDYTEWASDDYIKLHTMEEDGAKYFSGYAWDTMREVYRILKPDSWMIWWFGIQWYAPLFAALERVGFTVDKIPGIWYGGAGGAQTMQPEVNLARSYDTFFVCRKGSPVMIKRGRANVFAFDKVAPQNKIHPTEKPFELMKELFSIFVLPGMTAISPFLGSGNDLRALYSIGAQGFGFELDENLKNKFLLRVEDDVRNKLYTGSV